MLILKICLLGNTDFFVISKIDQIVNWGNFSLTGTLENFTSVSRHIEANYKKKKKKKCKQQKPRGTHLGRIGFLRILDKRNWNWISKNLLMWRHFLGHETIPWQWPREWENSQLEWPLEAWKRWQPMPSQAKMPEVACQMVVERMKKHRKVCRLEWIFYVHPEDPPELMFYGKVQRIHYSLKQWGMCWWEGHQHH